MYNVPDSASHTYSTPTTAPSPECHTHTPPDFHHLSDYQVPSHFLGAINNLFHFLANLQN